jgi:hypothetical protein
MREEGGGRGNTTGRLLVVSLLIGSTSIAEVLARVRKQFKEA